jgi:hypothetical protein
LSSKDKEPKVPEVKLEVPGALKALCVLSFLGFIYCLLLDSSDYLAYSTINEFRADVNADQAALEVLEERMELFRLNDIDVSDEGMERLGLMAIYRTIFDVLAMVGTALMFFQVKKGYYIYVIFQVLYVIVPFIMFGVSAFAIFDKGMVMIPIIYIGLFTTQLKHLKR